MRQQKDVALLKEFIRTKNPIAAKRAAERTKEGASILANNPESGKPVEELTAFRDLFIPFGNGNYVIRYRVDAGKVIIVRVKHSREESF